MRSKQNEKNPEDPFVDIGRWKTCAKLQQKILNSVVAGACQNVKFSRQNTWFLKNNGTCSKFLYKTLHCLISAIKL